MKMQQEKIGKKMIRSFFGFLIIGLSFIGLGYAIETDNIYLLWVCIFLPFIGFFLGCDGESGAA